MAIQFGQIRGSQIKQLTIETGHIKGQISKEKLDLGHLAAEDQRLQGEIDNIKTAIDNKNSNTKVFDTMEEFNTFAGTATPQVGDLVFVIDVKKSYIYKGVTEEAVYAVSPVPPEGWMYFDEISSEVDLAAYAKITDMQAADTELDGKITAAEGKLTAYKDELKAETGATKVGATYKGVTDATVQTVITGLDTRVDENKASIDKINETLGAIGGEDTDLAATITELKEADITLRGNIDTVSGKVTTLEGKVDVTKVSEAITVAVTPVSTKADANEAAITKLNGDKTVEGSVDFKIDAVKTAIHVHKKLIKVIGAADDKQKVMTATEFDIPQDVDGLYEDCTSIYVNGILQAEGINFSFLNAAGEVATEEKGKGVNFAPAELVEGDTVTIEWIEKRFK